jgi:AhpD family alkylhydroperoxidase
MLRREATMEIFDKPFHNWRSLRRETQQLTKALPALLGAFASGRVAPQMRETIMLACTATNRCRFCGFVHSHWAWALGVSKAQIRALLRREFDELFGDDHKVALKFAAHFAEQHGEPTTERIMELTETFGPKKGEDIQAFLRLIYFMNLSSNTFDAFLARAKGVKVVGGDLLFELLFAGVAAPILFPVFLAIHARRVLPEMDNDWQALVPG